MPHRVQTAGNLFSVFFTDDEVRDYDGAGGSRRGATRRSSTRCSTAASTCRRRAYEAWFVSAAHDDAVLDRIADALPDAARAAAGRHRGAVLRDDDHGAPAPARRGAQPRPRACTAGCPASTSPSSAGRWPSGRAKALLDRDIDLPRVLARWSGRRRPPAPMATAFGLPVAPDERLIEAENFFEGKPVRRRRRGLGAPAALAAAAQPVPPVLGRAVRGTSPRGCSPRAWSARDAAEGHEAVCVSHQLPIWTLRRYVRRQAAVAQPDAAASAGWPR